METCPAYSSNSRGFLYPQNICKLKLNYRSHPRLLDLYSDAFYGGELVAKADMSCERLSMLNWLPSPHIPGMYFLTMIGSYFP
jgi:superfamily I DNA and/or RNA helicase